MEQNLPTTYQAPAPAPSVNYFADIQIFEDGQRMCKLLAASDLVPQQFRNNVPNVMIALEMAVRTNSSPFQVMQNIYIVHGRPAWSATFIIAALNSCGRFSPLRFDMQGEGDSRICTAWVIEKGTGEKLEGPPVSIEMAKREGWYGKNGSKWQTMPELMLRYRAATFFGRLYAPDILMGMRTSDEMYDIEANEEMRRRPARRQDRQPTPAPEAMEQIGSPASVDEINAMLRAESAPAHPAAAEPVAEATAEPVAEQPQAEAQEQAKEAPAEDGGNPPEQERITAAREAAMTYMAEIDAINDAQVLKGWAMKRGYKTLAANLGGMESDEYKGVMRHINKRLQELEGKK